MPEREFRLTPSERTELRDRMRSRTLPAEDVRRARLMVLLAHGKSYLAIRQVLGRNPNYISRWKGRFEAERLAGLYSHHPGRAVEKRTPALEAKILEWIRRPPPDGSTHWSSRARRTSSAGKVRERTLSLSSLRSREANRSSPSRIPHDTFNRYHYQCYRPLVAIWLYPHWCVETRVKDRLARGSNACQLA